MYLFISTYVVQFQDPRPRLRWVKNKMWRSWAAAASRKSALAPPQCIHVPIQVTSVNGNTINLAALVTLTKVEFLLLLPKRNMSDPPYALFVLDKSVTNTVCITPSTVPLSNTKIYSTLTPL
jgi:hypothetical protein